MKRLSVILLCISLLLTGCSFVNFDLDEVPGISNVLDMVQGSSFTDEGPQETVPGTPEHIQTWTDPLEDIPEPTYYAIDEELQWALSYIGIEIIPPEDALDAEEPVIPMDGLWNTERTYSYKDSLTAENLQDFFAMYASDVDLTVLPPVMEPVVEPIGGKDNASGSAQKSFLEHYNEQSVLISYFENFVDDNIEAYNEDKEYNESIYLYLLPFSSWEIAMGASFEEDTDWEMLKQGITMAVELFGGSDVEVIRNAAHNYTITYKEDSGAVIVDQFRADAGNGIQMLCYSDGVLTEIFEFIALGDNTYVWQNNRERLVMRCQDKVVSACWYSYLNEDDTKYSENDLLYGTDILPDADWVMNRGNFHTAIGYDGTVMTVRMANSFFGGPNYVEITPAS